MMYVLGLTGSIGMGKSTTANIFRKLHIPVFDADATVHALYQGAAALLVGARFPEALTDGRIDRAVLRAEVLRDSTALKDLEAIIHPLVQIERAQFLARSRSQGTRLAVLDIPLLMETGQEKACDGILVVTAPEAVQKARLLERKGMTAEEFEIILAKQMKDADKRLRAHFILDTSLGIETAEREVAAIVRALAGCPGGSV